ncbi:unnamed protein product, partial [Nesidiocoris tenuis]
MRVHSAASTEKIVGGASPRRRSAALPDFASGAGPLSWCGNILWFEKCNTSEYAAGGHRPTRSDAAKHDNHRPVFRIVDLPTHSTSDTLAL